MNDIFNKSFLKLRIPVYFFFQHSQGSSFEKNCENQNCVFIPVWVLKPGLNDGLLSIFLFRQGRDILPGLQTVDE